MAIAKDRTGLRYGRLVAVEIDRSKTAASRNVFWRLRCDCGTEVVVNSGSLERGTTNSCGCMRSEQISARQTKHGILAVDGGRRTLAALQNAIYRCENPRNKRFAVYGQRGITVCARWKASPAAFVADMGICPPGLTLERIDCDGNYEPSNCRWASKTEQALNRRACWKITFDGREMTLAEYAETVGIHYATAKKKLGAAFGSVRTINLDKAV
jgi:hypothetical protein